MLTYEFIYFFTPAAFSRKNMMLIFNTLTLAFSDKNKHTSLLALTSVSIYTHVAALQYGFEYLSVHLL